jgi:DNA ligase-1
MVMALLYSQLVEVYEEIASTSKRLEMTDSLVKLIRNAPREIIGIIAYLTQGKLYPDFVGIEAGVAEKTAIGAIALAAETTKEEVTREWKLLGDLGSTAEALLSRTWNKRGILISTEHLTVEKVYETFDKIAKTIGEGSVETKLSLLSNLLIRASPKEAKYIIRTITGKLRLGIGDMTFLDALAIAYGGSKEAREAVERAYNMSSDLGLVAQTLATKGLEGIKDFQITIGRPVRPMLCERLTTAEDILEKLGGIGASEFKYDGLRIQAHISKSGISLFSRRLENLTNQFPDIIEGLKESLNVEDAVVDGECVAVDIDTGEILPFQVITHRRGRKYEIEQTVEKIPVVFVLFDILYVNSRTLIDVPYIERRKILESVVNETDKIKITHPAIVNDPRKLDDLLQQAVESGCEGLVVKSIAKDSVYQAGARGFIWIKYKREYKSEMADTLDLVIVGAFAGRGRRAGTYGALLMAAYDEETDSFKTICKLGTGLSDEELANLPNTLAQYRINHLHPRVESKIQADFWFAPAKVLEVRGAELTLSPMHTCGWGTIRNDAGLAVRFPRFTGRWRDDKAPEDATSVKEIVEMYKSQLKHVQE